MKKGICEKGITLIALVITIIVLLILAGVTIALLTGDNGILKNANTSKEETKIGEEKEKVRLARNADLISNKGENNTKEGLQRELDINIGKDKTKVIRDGKDNYIITFLDTNRNYRIKYGKEVEGPIEINIIKDVQAGDITKGNSLNGSIEKPYQINCIEDWVDFSNKSEVYNFFNEKYIIMTRNLDFLSELSYEDYHTTKYGDINNDGKNSELMEELTTGTGFKSINRFNGIFDGKGNELNNLYINPNQKDVGLFLNISNATIKNLVLNGKIRGNLKKGAIGGFVARAYNKCLLYNLKYSGEIEDNDISLEKEGFGGIIGYIGNATDIEINQCSNNANIFGNGAVGGIIGSNFDKVKIVNCYNTGNLTVTNVSVGGIIGRTIETTINIQNCYNTGIIINEVKNTYNSAAGILGSAGRSKNIIIDNCYNIGETKAKPEQASGGIQGSYWYDQYQSNIINCYYDGSKSDRSVYKTKEEYATKLTTRQMQGKDKIQNQDGTTSTLIELLNKGIDDNSANTDTSSWLRWKQGEEGYPVFE